MSDLSNEQIHEIMAALLIVPTSKVNGVSFDKIAKGLGELLVYREARDKAIGFRWRHKRLNDDHSWMYIFHRAPDEFESQHTLQMLYATPQPPVWFGIDWAAPQLTAVPDGFVLVPLEPTEEMVAEVWKGLKGRSDHSEICYMYSRMIAAAPKPE